MRETGTGQQVAQLHDRYMIMMMMMMMMTMNPMQLSDTRLPQSTQIPRPTIRHTHIYSQDKYHSTLTMEASVASETLVGYLSTEPHGVMFQKTLT